jgi:prepilin-type N-terminal cleavage/methylation domain-containing protein
MKCGDLNILRLFRCFTYQNDDKTGFTLAEVLITLLIIGVVASLVVPNLINDSQEAELHTAWKKAYSDLDQATRRMVLDNAGSLVGLCAESDDNCLRNLYTPYLNTNKICIAGQLTGNCWHKDGEWKRYNKSIVSGWGNSSGVILANGNLIRFEAWLGFPNCTNNTWVGTIQKCAFINLDVNGFKGPNIVGRDIYFMILTKDRLLPIGTTGDGYENDCISTNFGYGCAAKFLYQ